MAAMLSTFLVLTGALWREQIVRNAQYASSEYRQSVRRVRLPAVRGTIYDRHGVCVARNKPSYSIALFVEELRRPGSMSNTVNAIEHAIERLSAVLELPTELDREAIRMHLRRRMPIPLLAWRNVDSDALARWAERSAVEPGVDVYVEPVREYPFGESMAHILGYVGAAEPPETPLEPYHYYIPEMEGQVGVERSMNTALRGQAGGRLLRVDASGFKHEEIMNMPPREGRSLRLTVDAEIQQAAAAALEGLRGAVVVLDPRNGDVLAMASSPTFDTNLFSPHISSSDWNRLLKDPQRPLINRAVSGIYPPGSVFKPVVALAALVNRRADADTEYDCPGYYLIGNTRIACWHRWGHGVIAMRKAIEQSCNTYFISLGMATGYERIERVADALGLGRRTGIELPAESSGLLPGDAWKRRTMGDAWRAGDTCNVCIGQGALSVTPLQMAVLTATIANGGTLYRPRLLLGQTTEGEVVNRLAWSASILAVVRGGMYDVVQSRTGTGRNARVDGMEMGAKTGTAEFGPRGARGKHTWMIAFAPFDAPRYALAMIVEDGDSGGQTVAPLVRTLMESVLAIETRRQTAAGTGLEHGARAAGRADA
jgi:penicillin-binding protein 2